MTFKTLLKKLQEVAEEDHRLKDHASLTDVLDYLAIIGVEGASEAYMSEIKKSLRKDA